MNEVQIIKHAAHRYGIPAAVLYGVWGAESSFRKKGVAGANSGKGAQGPFQFMPGTAAGLGIDPNNFWQAAHGAAKYLAQYKDRGTAGMLAAYNAGPAGDPNNSETRAYIPRVLDYAQQFRTTHGDDHSGGGSAGGGGGSAGGGGNGGKAGQQSSRDRVTVRGGSPGKYTPGTPAKTDYAAAFVDAIKSRMGQGVQPIGSGQGLLQTAMQLAHSGQYTTPGTPAKVTDPRAPKATLVKGKGGSQPANPGKGGGNVPQASGAVVGHSGGHKLVKFDGETVPRDFARQMAWARKHGWTGKVNSGMRTKAEQLVAARNYGLQHYPNGPLASNHVYGNGGAVDVEGASQLDAILKKYPGKRTMVWAGPTIGDYVHFSRNGH